MKLHQNLQMKLTFIVFTVLLAVVLSGAASAALVLPEQSYTSAYVVETGYSFTGPNSIQDAVDNYETNDGYQVLLEPGNHDEQVVINKNLNLTGMGANPEDTVIQATSDGATVTIASGVAVVMENLTIWNYGNGPLLVNNGQLTLINCILNGTCVAYEVYGAATGGTTEVTGTPGDTTLATTETLLLASVSGATSTTGTIVVGDTTSVTGTTNTISTSTEGTTSTDDPGVPLASLASGMLMVMGGTVVSGRKHP